VAHFQAQGPIYVVTLSLLFVLSVVAAITRNQRFHGTFSVFFLLYLLAFISVNLRVLA
jgi:hypothetical protein